MQGCQHRTNSDTAGQVSQTVSFRRQLKAAVEAAHSSIHACISLFVFSYISAAQMEAYMHSRTDRMAHQQASQENDANDAFAHQKSAKGQMMIGR